MLTVRASMFECLYVFVVLELGRRIILHTEVTANPTAQYVAEVRRPTLRSRATTARARYASNPVRRRPIDPTFRPEGVSLAAATS